MASLNDDPRNYELEDFVAAHFACRGVFVETGVTERDPEDLLELDVVWTDYDDDSAPRHPAEIKSGRWGIGDLFKFYGWSRYLGLDQGWYFCRQLPGRLAPQTIFNLCQRLQVSLFHIEDLNEVNERFQSLSFREPPRKELPSLWRYSFWVQRRLLASLGVAIEADTCSVSAKAARDYRKLINDVVFFEPEVPARVHSLLEAHLLHPRLARTAAAEIAGMGADFDEPPTSTVFSDALYHGKYFPVQACLFLAHKGRLGVIKAAVDYIIAKRNGTLKEEYAQIFGQEIDLSSLSLSNAFNETVQLLESASNVRRYPVFWQVFLWLWGGFILEDRIEEECESLSAQTGVPVDEIDFVFDLWGRLFPVDGGWFITPQNDSRRQLKLMPPALRGLGAFSRLARFEVKEYEEFRFSDRTASRLASDHNATVRLLDCDVGDLVN